MVTNKKINTYEEFVNDLNNLKFNVEKTMIPATNKELLVITKDSDDFFNWILLFDFDSKLLYKNECSTFIDSSFNDLIDDIKTFSK